MTEKEFDRVWTLMRELWPNGKNAAAERKRRIWQHLLQPYEKGDVTEAVLAHARRSKFFPDPADITGALTQTAAKSKTASGQEELDWILTLLRQTGEGREPSGEDPGPRAR